MSATPMSVNSSHTAIRTTFRDATTPTAETHVAVATRTNRMSGSGIGGLSERVGRLGTGYG